MTEAIAVVEDKQFTVDEKKILRETLCPGATDVQLDFFGKICASKRLNPFSNQICMVLRKAKNPDGSYSMKPTIQTTVDGFRAIAARNPLRKFGTVSLPEFGPPIDVKIMVWENGKQVAKTTKAPSWAKVGIKFKLDGEWLNQEAIVRWEERYSGNNPQYEKMPFGMLAKCAESLAFRMAYPEDMSGLYEESEVITIEDEQPQQLAARNELTATLLDMPAEEGPIAKAAKGKAKKKEDVVVVKAVDNASKEAKDKSVARFMQIIEGIKNVGGNPTSILGCPPSTLLINTVPAALDVASENLEKWLGDAEKEANDLFGIEEPQGEPAIEDETSIEKEGKELLIKLAGFNYSQQKIYEWLKKPSYKDFTATDIQKIKDFIPRAEASNIAKKAQGNG